MRVTQGMLNANMLRNLNQSNALLAKYQEQLYSERKINRPSDDPVIAVKGMGYRTNLAEVEQYSRNLTEMYNWMDNSEAGLEQANAIMQRTRELIVKASNEGVHDEDDQLKIKAEITELKKALVDVANTQVAGKYIFNGTDTTNPPVDGQSDPIEVTINANDFEIEISKNIKIKANINAEEVFGQEVFEAFEALENRLEGNNDNVDLDEHITQFDEHIGNMLAERAELGARYNRIELVENRLDSQEVLAKKLITENEGINMEEVITNLKMQEAIHRASLSAGARIMQPSLLDFLR